MKDKDRGKKHYTRCTDRRSDEDENIPRSHPDDEPTNETKDPKVIIGNGLGGSDDRRRGLHCNLHSDEGNNVGKENDEGPG